jgi:hypothetical protein
VAGYSYLTFQQLISALLQRLQDVSGVFTTTTEAGLYLTEALQVLNANTSIWNAQFTLDFLPGSGWQSLNQTGSPRIRTITDTQIYTQMQYMLMEPPSGGTWTGTNQFNITNLSQALQYRRDELLLASGANMVQITNLNSPVAGVSTTLPDTVLNLRRVRWIPSSLVNYQTPYTLWREDIESANAYGDTLSIQTGTPESWLITADAPLTFDVSVTPNTPGMWDLLAMESGVTLSPPTSNVLGLPNDWCWVAKYGALADCLSNSPEASDPLRAKYCLDRYQRGMKAMLNLPWLIQASVANLPVDTISYVEMDAYSQSWETEGNPNDPNIIVGGMDFVALAPFVPNGNPTVSSVLTVVGNAPIPNLPTDQIQLSRDGVEAVLCYAQHIASFKMGGADFQATLPLYKQFEDYCAVQNKRYAALGIFRPDMLMEGTRGDEIDPVFGPPKGVKNV